MALQIAGTTALVTGASRGIGRALSIEHDAVPLPRLVLTFDNFLPRWQRESRNVRVSVSTLVRCSWESEQVTSTSLARTCARFAASSQASRVAGTGFTESAITV
jgi:hypothetical protein